LKKKFRSQKVNNFYVLLAGIEPIEPPGLRAYYDCQSKCGVLATEWNCIIDKLDTAYMFFNISSTQENEYKWEIQHERIKQPM